MQPTAQRRTSQVVPSTREPDPFVPSCSLDVNAADLRWLPKVPATQDVQPAPDKEEVQDDWQKAAKHKQSFSRY